MVDIVHAQEGVTGPDSGADSEALDHARSVVRDQLDLLAAQHILADGHVLLHATDHGAVGRLVAEYATRIGATTIVIGPPTDTGLPALMDESASAELRRHARANIVIAAPAHPAPGGSRPPL
jgi:hypothetical protein